MECHTIITIVLVELIVASGSVLATQGEKTIVPEFYSWESGYIALTTNSTDTILADTATTINLKESIKDKKMSETTSNYDLDPQIMAVISQFKTQTQDRRGPAKKLLPLLEKNTSMQKIETILGMPTSIVWDYTLFYSSTLIVNFDNAGKVKEVSSDILDEVIPLGANAGDKRTTEIMEAISIFKGQPYNRQKPAKKLLPLVKAGMSIKEIEAMLGPPDGKSWVYSLLHTSSSSLILHFSNKDKVEEVTSTDLIEDY